MPDAVVYPYEGFVPEEGEGAGGYGDGLEGGAHAGAAGVAYAIDIFNGYFGFFQSGFYDGDEPLAVVFGGVFGEETFAGGGDEGVADVGEGDCGAAFGLGGVED